MGARTYPDMPRAYVDMDGVIADFDRQAKALGLTPSEAKHRAGFYRELPMVEGAYGALADLEIMGYDVWIATKIPSGNPYAATEKLLWVREALPKRFHDQVIITPDKGALGKPGDILIDDHPEWANAYKFRGLVIRFLDWRQATAEAERAFA
jgi:5'(3')-deoxyribonucleotidase